MSKRQKKQRSIEHRWMTVFGEPPFIRTDPDLMLQILETEERRRGPTTSEARAA
jgi:hypothetical protein